MLRVLIQLLLLCTVLAVSGCCEYDETRSAVIPDNKGLLVEEIPGGNVTLYLSTEGTEETPVDLEVFLDGAAIICGNFGEGDLHPFYVEYQFEWTQGTHDVSVASSKVTAPASLQVEISDRSWIVVTYEYASAKGLNIQVFDEAVTWR